MQSSEIFGNAGQCLARVTTGILVDRNASRPATEIPAARGRRLGRDSAD